MKQHDRSAWPVTVAIAVLALVLGSVGTAAAGPALTTGKVKAIAAQVVKKKAPTLTVAKAKTVAKGGVTSKSVANRSLVAADIAVGVVPADGYVFLAMNVASDPTATPDSPAIISQLFTLPRSGTVHLRLFGARFSGACSSGGAVGGLYIDGSAVPGTARNLPASGNESAIELLGTVPLSKGAHTVSYGVNCPSGTNTASTYINATWTVMMAAK